MAKKKTSRTTTSESEVKSNPRKPASGKATGKAGEAEKKARSGVSQAAGSAAGQSSAKSSASRGAKSAGNPKASRSPVKSKTATRAEDAAETPASSASGNGQAAETDAQAKSSAKAPTKSTANSKAAGKGAAGRPAGKAAAAKAKATESAEAPAQQAGDGEAPRKRVLQVVAKSSVIRPRQGTDGSGRPPTVFLGSTNNGNDVAPREPLTEDDLRRVKSGLTKRDLERYRKILLERAAEIKGDVEALRQDARNEAGKDISYDHMADAGSDTFEQDLNLGLVESEQRNLVKIYDALQRMDNGYYGVCIESGKPIGKPRLDIKPWARFCIEVAREKDPRLL